jgi:chemotaxis protein CheD
MTAGSVRTLMPGDVICGDRDERLETLLGSCVSVVLTDRRRTIGAMCHIVHASRAPGPTDNPGAFADFAIDSMYRLLRDRGFSPGLCDAYVYGGGNMFPDLVVERHVGETNARTVLDRLRQDGVHLVKVDLGGANYRRLSWKIGPDHPQVATVAV